MATHQENRGQADLDEMLSQPELHASADRFHERYKLSMPPHKAPADSLVSRLTRELQKRQLSVREIFSVKTQAMQASSVKRRQKLTERIDLVHHGEEAEVAVAETFDSFMLCLFILMLALSIAGCVKRTTAPSTQESRSSDACDFVEVPLDIMLRYHARVEEKALKVPYSQRLAWVQDRDWQERSVWIDRFRNSTMSLGEIVRDIMRERESMWGVYSPPPATP
jgi:hypothetical protein